MRVLVVDPREESRDLLRRAFSAFGDQVRGATTPAEGEKHLAEFAPDAVIAAFEGPGDETGRFLARARETDPRRGLFALIDGERLEDGVLAMSLGAHDFLWTPISEGRVALLRARLEARREREAGIEEMRVRLARSEIATSLPGRSEPWKAALAALEREAPLDSPVLLTGESGTEKEPAARAIHRLSPRGSEPFVVAGDGASLESDPARGGSLFVPHVEHVSERSQANLASEAEAP